MQSHQQLQSDNEEVNQVSAKDFIVAGGSSKGRSLSGTKQRAVNTTHQHQNFLLTEPIQGPNNKFSHEVPKILNSGKITKAPQIPTNRYKNDTKQPNLNQTAPIQNINQNNAMGQMDFQSSMRQNSNNLRTSQNMQTNNQPQLIQSTPQPNKNKQDNSADHKGQILSQQAPQADRVRSFSSAATEHKNALSNNDQPTIKDGRSSSTLVKQPISNTQLVANQFNSGNELPSQSENLGNNQVRPSSRQRTTIIQQNSSNQNARAQPSKPLPISQMKNNISLGAQNLHNYFETQMNTYQSSNIQTKPLPRKKRLQSGTDNGTHDLSTDDLKVDQGYSSQKLLTNTASHGPNSGTVQTEPSPKRQPSLQSNNGQKPQLNLQKPKLNIQKPMRPQNPTYKENQTFQQGEIFLNVDPQYNQILYQLIQPN